MACKSKLLQSMIIIRHLIVIIFVLKGNWNFFSGFKCSYHSFILFFSLLHTLVITDGKVSVPPVLSYSRWSFWKSMFSFEPLDPQQS